MSRNTVTVEPTPDKSYAVVKFRGIEIVCNDARKANGSWLFMRNERETARTDAELPDGIRLAIRNAIEHFERTTLTTTAY